MHKAFAAVETNATAAVAIRMARIIGCPPAKRAKSNLAQLKFERDHSGFSKGTIVDGKGPVPTPPVLAELGHPQMENRPLYGVGFYFILEIQQRRFYPPLQFRD
jgi:hypothetical protein